jgi:lipid II isoglutaminyl synthase (glutamine-hydrolysing)
MKITIGYLYGDLMNMYGDTGNITALKRRAQWRGIEVNIKNFSIGDKMKDREADIFFFGGGQDQQQDLVAKDLKLSLKGKIIKDEIERGVPLLAICGGYQLLGEYYQPFEGVKLPGVDLFPIYTEASHDRMIGNIVVRVQGTVNSEQSKTVTSNLLPVTSLVGFENHSGKTYLKEGAEPLGIVKTGFGNNGEDKTEGCIYKNAIGCYMHGSLLPKNPQLADWLISKALETKYNKPIELKPLNDDLENTAHNKVIEKFTN